MAPVAVDPASGALVAGGRKVVPLCLSNGPPRDRVPPSGRNGLAEVAAAGINMIRAGSAAWGPKTAPGLIALDPRHPLVVTQAPGRTAAQLTPFGHRSP